ncbi:MAG: NAD+ synthase [Candidatus Liberibacter europaeus]|uniref:Glutamine-dependent NAD(+) synthetase n=1 Tax=Candidatus Liberibacter europaeus TaxID=744859 RepID=A0A2T4VWP3_9HYPH|nr:NAD+ synthase [Candidatus Liberibacter europaeus]PTL86170.1 MAG: NAD+ synthase [Candidatus Liberibacter europaeus]
MVYPLIKSIKIAIAQLNPTVGDIAGNIYKARHARIKATSQGADLILFTELFISGYPPEDLVFKTSFIQSCYDAIDTLRNDTHDNGAGIIIGFPRKDAEGVFNSVAILDAGNIIAIRDKINLPNYDEFHEKRTFVPGRVNDPIEFRNIKIGVIICEDLWKNSIICQHLKEKGAEIILTINASPYCRNKLKARHETVCKQISQINLPIIYSNQIGGQDELVFDGGSFCFNSNNKLALQMKQFEEQNIISKWIYKKKSGWYCTNNISKSIIYTHNKYEETDYSACVIGLRDYVRKNNFHKVIIGISGGIDSALCATMAVDALGKENVQTIMLPYIYTSKQSLEDAAACSKALDCQYDVLPIKDIVDNFYSIMSNFFKEKVTGIVAENIQSRIRSNILMTISNNSGAMLITTSNKSEISVGYGTLYGDMSGGFNPIKDIYKTQVYKLAHWRNSHCMSGGLGPFGKIIPIRILEKKPSAELRYDQCDQDSLPPYPILDDIIEQMVEYEASCRTIAKKEYSIEIINHIENLLYQSEYKRRQSVLGTKITSKSFGRDRLYPISNKFRDQ